MNVFPQREGKVRTLSPSGLKGVSQIVLLALGIEGKRGDVRSPVNKQERNVPSIEHTADVTRKRDTASLLERGIC